MTAVAKRSRESPSESMGTRNVKPARTISTSCSAIAWSVLGGEEERPRHVPGRVGGGTAFPKADDRIGGADDGVGIAPGSLGGRTHGGAHRDGPIQVEPRQRRDPALGARAGQVQWP